MPFSPKPLHPDAARLCEQLAAPPLLVRHLTLVHDAAVELLNGLAIAFPGLCVDREAVLFGAAIHDIGKIKHPEELVGPGDQHEIDGPALLEQHGAPSHLARFAHTHGRWRETTDIEDLLVALSDSIWCGRRVGELEAKVATVLAAAMGEEEWKVWNRVDSLCTEIASRGDERLAWQAGG